MGTTKKTAKKRAGSAAQSHSKGKRKSKVSKTKRKSGPPKGPIITWSKVKCFALGLAVAHQWKWRKNGTAVTDWKAVLEVINDVYLQEFDDFKAIYPDGLINAAKLRSEYSDRERGRHAKWRLKQDQCTPREIQEMLRMRQIVFSTERRLSLVPGSLVSSPGPDAADWVWYQVQPSETTAEKPVRKHTSKTKDDWESEAEDDVEIKDEGSEEEDGDDDTGEDDSEEESEGDDNDEEKRSIQKDADEEEGSNGSDDGSDLENEGGNIIVARSATRSRQIIVVAQEDDDAEVASDEKEIGNAADAIIDMREKAGRARSAARQTRPQRKKTRLNEVQNADEVDEQSAPSTFFRDAFAYGAYQEVTYNFEQSSKSLQNLGNLELLPMSTVHGDGALNNAIIQAKGAAAIGNQGGMNITPARQAELLRRHEQSDTHALRYDQAVSFKGLAPPNYPPIQLLHDRILNSTPANDGDGTTEPGSYSYHVFRRTLIAAFQASRRIDFWAEAQRIQTQWNIVEDLINPMIDTTGMSPANVSNAITIATKNEADSSIEFGQLLAMPTKIDQSRGEPNGTLDNIVQQIIRQRKLQMIHTNDVDFSTQPPTFTIRKHTSGPGNEFRFVHLSNILYKQTGEIRRVLLTDETTRQGKEVDVMLCDKPLCAECEPQEDMFERNSDYAEQRRQLPLVHHKDVVMFEDKNLYFAPMQQGPVLNGAAVIKRDIHDVIFGHGFSRVIFCDKARCRPCRGVSCVADLVYPHAR